MLQHQHRYLHIIIIIISTSTSIKNCIKNVIISIIIIIISTSTSTSTSIKNIINIIIHQPHPSHQQQQHQPRDEMSLDPNRLSLVEYDPFDILGLNPRATDWMEHLTLYKAYTRACKHTDAFATSGTLTLPPQCQIYLAYQTLRGPFREPARFFWRLHHRSTWNPHAPVGSVKAGLPIRRRGLKGFGPTVTAILLADAVAATEAHVNAGAILGPFIPPPALQEALGRERSDFKFGALPAVVLHTYLLAFKSKGRENAVVAMLDGRGRYYRRVLDRTVEGKLLQALDHNFSHSCPPVFIDYLPRFRGCTEPQVIAMVRQELALRQEGAPPPTGEEDV
ncbi:MAG: hypothetical protein M1826_007612 [Phylliscum demangeonii]|nr:MAG: hypothetical protein M1826_007612 [Phylliscum demangeonii]